VDLKQIEKLMIAMRQSQIKRVVFKKEDFEIEIESETTPSLIPAAPPSASHFTPDLHSPLTPAVSMIPKKISEEPSPSASKEKGGGVYITSPMVGTFYASPSPDDPPFAKVGDPVQEGNIVCIVEAMKVMNEVKAGVKGVIAEILLKNGEPVEFGTQMFRVMPA
jgi:acetyl-CoA carboxylase biotin carboxyl carrier protein